MSSYKSSAELKAMAKEQLFGKYAVTVSASIIVFFFTLAAGMLSDFLIPSATAAGAFIHFLFDFILSLFTGIFTSGMTYLFLKITCGQPVSTMDVFYGFKANPDKALLITLLLQTVSLLTTKLSGFFSLQAFSPVRPFMLLAASVSLVVGLVVSTVLSLIYSQAYYLLHDFPGYSTKELLRMSRHMMKGHKGRLFYIRISFLPLFLLGTLSFGLAYLWLIPYMRATLTNFYMDLVKNKNNQRVTA